MSNLIRTDIINSSEHVVIGDKQRDVIIQTKGKIKVQYGNKFIDLFNFGELNQNSDYYSKEEVIELINTMKSEIINQLSNK